MALVRILAIAAIVLAVAGAYRLGWRGDDDPLVVYCAHDAIFSRQVLDEFERRTGISVDQRFDNEATKSLGLTQQIIAEKDNPRCDVFWNNQMLGTIDLARRGLLEPYKGPGYERIPDRYKDPQGLFTGFAARLRVYIINTDLMQPTPQAVEQVLAGDLSRVAVAKPIFGTTLTHYAVLWDLWGEQRVKSWRADWQSRSVIERGGNSTTKQLVADSQCMLGWTDTDDFFVAHDDGKPVAMLPVRVGDGGGKVICIPNTVAIIKGAKHPAKARKLIDFLLSEQVELMLANSKARQIPLGPVDETQVPDQVRKLRQWSANSYDLRGLHESRRAVLAWLGSE